MSVHAQWNADSGQSVAQLVAGDARFAADLDLNAGGSGLVPTPHDLLDASLASCTVLTLQLYSKRKQYPMEGASVSVTHEEANGLYQMTRQIQLTGELNDAQRADLLRVANLCPLHKTLSGQFAIATALVA
ncbi:putative redox protein [Actimicrobium sp. GrIS 1.19]|uniref:OsmC family protein n=1 Tax=Actimicrobium sp. GrIS 1.19 TaxID=3071708 RepID=UPI002E07055C|nr:putative redox protein [Actimicrobium sp. GrIS 1.19]